MVFIIYNICKCYESITHDVYMSFPLIVWKTIVHQTRLSMLCIYIVLANRVNQTKEKNTKILACADLSERKVFLLESFF